MEREFGMGLDTLRGKVVVRALSCAISVALVSVSSGNTFAAAAASRSLIYELKCKGGSSSHNIYIYNGTNSREPIYVMVSKDTAWAIADFVVDVTSLALGVGAVKGAVKGIVKAGSIPAKVKNILDLHEIVKLAALLGTTAHSGAKGALEAKKKLVDALKKNSITINPGECVNVRNDSYLGKILSLDVSKYASLFGARPVRLLVVHGGTYKSAEGASGSDMSWLAGDKSLLPVKHGTIVQVDLGRLKEKIPFE
ncbi:hypothetical protein [Streptomyces aureoversilis]|uniref:Uncharacterized protein n=1 Tax=Streptomyces aureoversilis TaxID=67277 RepID=A0ABW0A914_9ACTN